MKHSLPVAKGLSMTLVAAVLMSGCSLGLPGSDSDENLANSGKRLPLPDAAPRIDPQDLDVEYIEPRSFDEQKKKRKAKKTTHANRKDRGDRRHPGGDGRRPGTAKSRSAPDIRDRDPDEGGNAANPAPGRKRNPKKEPEPKDPPAVVVSDLTGDPEGEGQAPGYMDFEQVRLQASGGSFIAELTFGRRIPARMPTGGTNMLASIEVDRGGKKLSVYAEGSESGWRAHTNRHADFPGRLEIQGRTMRFTLARSFFGDRFDWYAHSSWTKSTTTKTDYFFDFAPDDQNGRFPSGGTT